jgi:HPt (histidine-containing phosphotransfer) domain-containing protein
MPAIPLAPIYSTLGGDLELGDLVRQFVDEVPNRVTSLQEFLANGDWQGLRRVAHQMKGAAGSYGFSQLTPYAAAVEQALLDDRPEQDVWQLVDDLVATCRQLRAGESEQR